MQLSFSVITETLLCLTWDLWDSGIDGRARLRRSEGEKKQKNTAVEQTVQMYGPVYGAQTLHQYKLTSVKLKKSPMPPTNRRTSPAYCSMMLEQELQDDSGCLVKQLYESDDSKVGGVGGRKSVRIRNPLVKLCIGFIDKAEQTPTAAQVPLGLT